APRHSRRRRRGPQRCPQGDAPHPAAARRPRARPLGAGRPPRPRRRRPRRPRRRGAAGHAPAALSGVGLALAVAAHQPAAVRCVPPGADARNRRPQAARHRLLRLAAAERRATRARADPAAARRAALPAPVRGLPAMTLARYFEQVWQEGDDPFGYRSRWYETRKRDLLLAALPRPEFERGWEIGCANGELTRKLATRCDALLGTDLNRRAVTVARQRCAGLGDVELRCMEHPREWPDGRFDLVVVGEMGYYLDDTAMQAFAHRIDTSLAPRAVLLACHWRHGFDGRHSDTLDV